MAAVSSSPPTATRTAGLLSRLRLVSLFTLLSRVLGLVRDVGMATLFGNGAVMDAFSVAFRVPNLSRRLFGEGALTAAFLPVFVRELEQTDRESAWRLASAIFSALALVLCGLVLLGEVLLWAAVRFGELSPETELLAGLTAAMLPYLVTICLAAQVSAVLQALNHFTWPALLPVLLNLVWIAGIWLVAPGWDTPAAQAYVIAGCVLAGGCLQLLAPLPALYRLGFRFRRGFSAVRPRVVEIGRSLLPVLVGLSITQINTLADSLIAWLFSAPQARPQASMPLPGEPAYPMQSGAASALYFGQRLYQFPLGVFGVALGTVLFPLLAAHAGRGRTDLLREDLSLGLRLILCIGLPASAGLVILAGPLTSLLFRHGSFDAHDAGQTARMTAVYATAVWAYCGLLVLQRAFYSVGDRTTPLRLGLLAVAANLVLNLTLIWIIGADGLAAATAATAVLQLLAFTVLVERRLGRLDRGGIARTAWRSLLATAAMSAACLVCLHVLPDGEALWKRAVRVMVPVLAGLAVYSIVAAASRLDELRLLLRGGSSNAVESDPPAADDSPVS